MPTPNIDGLDLSHWNVVTDETQIPRYRLMSCKATEGRSFVSPKFTYFWDLFARLGATHRGAYHWVRSDSPMSAQVDHLARTLDRVGGLLRGDFVQLDWETTVGVPNVTVAQIEEWLELANQRWGDRIIVYGAPWVPGFIDWRHRNPTTPVWLANYNVTLGPKGGWVNSSHYKAAVWQWSSTWKVPGFLWNPDNPDDGVDVNHVFDWPTLDRLTLQPTTPLPPDPPLVEEEVDMLRKVLAPNFDAAEDWWPYLGCFDSGVVRPLATGDLDPVDGIHFLTDEGQYRRLAVTAGVDLTDEFPDGATAAISVAPAALPNARAETTIVWDQ